MSEYTDAAAELISVPILHNTLSRESFTSIWACNSWGHLRVLLLWYGWKIICFEIAIEIHVKTFHFCFCLMYLHTSATWSCLVEGVTCIWPHIQKVLDVVLFWDRLPVLTRECGFFCLLNFLNNYFVFDFRDWYMLPVSP